MIRALIVDDEPMHIQGLVRHVHWNELGYNEPLTATSGELALRIVQQCPIDVLITDVSMPIMNGIELVGQIKQLDSRVQVLIISGYDEFEFVQEAIHVGAQGYVLKPIKIDEVESKLIAMRDAYEKLHQMEEEAKALQSIVTESLDVVKERFLSELIEEEVLDDEAMQSWSHLLQLPQITHGLRLMLFRYDHVIEGSKDASSRVMRGGGLLKAAQLSLSDLPNIIIARTAIDEVIAVHVNPEPSELVSAEKQITLIQHMMKEQYLSTVTVVISQTFNSWQEAALRYKKLMFLIANARMLEQGQVLYEDRIDEQEFEDYRVREEFIPHIIEMIEQSIQAKDVLDYVANVFDMLRAQRTFSYCQAFGIGLISELARLRKRLEQGNEDHTVPVWEQLIRCQHSSDIRSIILQYIEQLIQSKEKQRSCHQHHLISKVMQCIAQQLHESITLKVLAEKFHMNSSYLSVLFKKETGKTISEYIQEMRIKKAMELLGDPQIRIYEVAEQVGFQTSAYFTYLFKKHTGRTPQEYRDYH